MGRVLTTVGAIAEMVIAGLLVAWVIGEWQPPPPEATAVASWWETWRLPVAFSAIGGLLVHLAWRAASWWRNRHGRAWGVPHSAHIEIRDGHDVVLRCFTTFLGALEKDGEAPAELEVVVGGQNYNNGRLVARVRRAEAIRRLPAGKWTHINYSRTLMVSEAAALAWALDAGRDFLQVTEPIALVRLQLPGGALTERGVTWGTDDVRTQDPPLLARVKSLTPSVEAAWRQQVDRV